MSPQFTPQLKVALIRGLIAAFVGAGTTFFAAMAAHTTAEEAAIAAGGAAFAALSIRFAAEGLIDTAKAKTE